MSKRFLAPTILVVMLAMAAALPATADTTLYSNGPANPFINAYNFTGVWSLTDSFTLAQASTVNSVSLQTWVDIGDVPLDLDWRITSAPFGGTVFGSGASVALLNTYVTTLGISTDIYTSSFSTGGVSLAAGPTFWLELSNGATTTAGTLYWEENDGASLAKQFQSHDSITYTRGSEAFDLLGVASGATVTPEPSSLILLSTGLLSLGGIARRKLKS